MKLSFAVVCGTILFSLSCSHSHSHEQNNPILRTHASSSMEYRQELQRLIEENPSDVAYYFEQRKGNTLVLHCDGNNFSGELEVLVQQEDSHSQKLQNDKGYRGAEIKGLQIAFTDNATALYTGAQSIVD